MVRLATSGRAAATYMLLAGLQRGVSLLILPFVTHSMSPGEYGASSMMSAASLLITSFIAVPLTQVIIRAASRGEENGPALLRAAGSYCYFVLPIVTTLLAAAVALFVPQLLGVSGLLWSIELVAIGLQPAASTFAMWVAQAHADLPKFVWLSSTSVILTAGTKIVLVVVLKMGVLGWVVSDLISAVLSAALAICLIRLPRVRLRSEHIRYVLRFSLPLIPHSASLWAITSLSRPAMAAVTTLEQVGLLAFGLNLASIAVLVLAEANRAALPHFSREVFPSPTHETLEPVKWQLVAAFVVPAIVGAIVAVAGRWLFAETYWPSFFLTGILLVGQSAYGLYLIPMNYLTQTAGSPKYSAVASGAGALLILLSILVLGHSYGALGVAYATTGGYLTMATVALILTKTHRLDIAWRTWLPDWPAVALGVGALGCSVAALLSPTGSTIVWALAGSSLLLASGALALTRRERRSGRHTAGHQRRA